MIYWICQEKWHKIKKEHSILRCWNVAKIYCFSLIHDDELGVFIYLKIINKIIIINKINIKKSFLFIIIASFFRSSATPNYWIVPYIYYIILLCVNQDLL